MRNCFKMLSYPTSVGKSINYFFLYKIIILLIFSVFFSNILTAQKNSIQDTLKWQLSAKVRAAKLEAFFNLRKWDSYVRFNHPKLINLMGGAEKMTETVTQQMQTIESEMVIESFEFGIPTGFIECDSMINCLLSQTIVLSSKKDAKSVRVNNFLLGFSEDDGVTWYFIDPDIGAELLKKIVPNKCKNLKIPKRTSEIKNKN